MTGRLRVAEVELLYGVNCFLDEVVGGRQLFLYAPILSRFRLRSLSSRHPLHAPLRDLGPSGADRKSCIVQPYLTSSVFDISLEGVGDLEFNGQHGASHAALKALQSFSQQSPPPQPLR